MTVMPGRSAPRSDAVQIARSSSLIGGSAIVRLLWAGGLAALLWIAAAWAMGWL